MTGRARNVVTAHPAATTAATSNTLVALIAAIQGHDLIAVACALGALAPAAALWVIAHGGLLGLARRILRGNTAT